MKIYYNQKNINEWKSKKLIKKWKKEFSALIQNHHYKICINPENKLPLYTFYEYFTGVYFAKKGYKFLFEPYIENYLLAKYKSKELRLLQQKFLRIVKKVMGKEKFQELRNICQNYKTGQPDLFIYHPENKKYFFAEVKSEKDNLREHQDKLIKQFSKIVPVKIVYLLKQYNI